MDESVQTLVVAQVLVGERVRLRLAADDDIAALAAIRAKPEVYRWWRGAEDLVAETARDLSDPDTVTYVIELGPAAPSEPGPAAGAGPIVGAVQWGAETEPDYRHASIDIYLDPASQGQGLGTDAVRTLARHLTTDLGFHRVVIDPAADNVAAIRCYEKVGFRPVGIMREYERGPDGSWHDGLLMDLLAHELADPGIGAPPR